jgi:hypothetical protein
VLGAACLSVSACTVSVESPAHIIREERRFVVPGRPEITLVTFDGPIEIRSWEKPDVRVEVELRATRRDLIETMHIESGQSGERLRVEVQASGERRSLLGLGLEGRRRAALIASVPRDCDVSVRSGDGVIRAEGLAGRVELRTADGSIRGLDLHGDIAAHTGDGSIKLESIDGRVALHTGDGGIAVSGRFDVLRARTGDGSLLVRVLAGSHMTEDWDLSTGDGGIALYLPPIFDARIDAYTGGGVIRLDRGVVVAGSSQGGGGRLQGTMGSGGRLLRVHTGDGTVSFRSASTSADSDR